MDVGAASTIASAISLLIAALVGYLSIRTRKSVNDSKWRKDVEPKYLDALDYIYRIHVWAAARGYKDKLPEIPKRLTEVFDEDTPAAEQIIHELHRQRRDQSVTEGDK